jgi:hypothetical protein
VKTKYLVLSLFLLLARAPSIGASVATPWKCYEYTVTNNAAPDIHENANHREHWCRARFGTQEFLFNADLNEPHAELAALIDYDNSGKVIAVTHGSLNQGKVSIYRSLSPEINPLPVPIDPQEAQRQGHVVRFVLAQEKQNAAFKLLSRFRSRLVETSISRPRVAAGTFESDLPDSALPWRGYWWPMKNYPLANGSNSPLAKYDRIIQQTLGYDPGSVAWEVENHALSSDEWDGHCNGWAAATILYPEPTSALRDPMSGVELEISDIKGLLSEAGYCISDAFYGHRYNGPGDDPSDIYPDQFHKVLLYYIDGVKKPIIYDYERLEPIDNNIITGYEMTITKAADSPSRFHVNVSLHSHRYDYGINQKTGPAYAYIRNYEYYLDTDSSGNITGGEWISTNPDFLWVPLSRATCLGENPGVTPENLQKILSTSTPISSDR